MTEPRVDSSAPDERFAFGANWARFLSVLNEDRIVRAEQSLRDMLGVEDLAGKQFLDVGSGSGLFSLAARRLGARVRSFDYDLDSVDCTAELRRRYFPDDTGWRIERGSALDEAYIRGLGTFDVVYSWGVLHHTGQMWRAMELVTLPVAPQGRLFIAIYNLQSPLHYRMSLAMKRRYVRSGPVFRGLLVGAFYAFATGREIIASLAYQRPPLERIRNYTASSRGMSWWHDIADWVGGYPYEAAKAEAVFDFYHARGYTLDRLRTDPPRGLNQFVFTLS